jgi:plasmid replication initiation protein
MSFSELLVSMHINSPMAQALKADAFQAMANYFELVQVVTSAPPQVGQYIHIMRYLDQARQTMMVPPDVVPTDKERAEAAQAMAVDQAGAIVGEAAVRAAPQLVDLAANGNGAMGEAA